MGKCSFDGCELPATQLAAGRHYDEETQEQVVHAVMPYCAKHVEEVARMGEPEYVVGCPHCKCRFGVS